jgi:S1-C subfamily serine protease
LGAKLSEPVGDELSAFGAAFADGGVAISQMDENSVLKKYGLKAGDLIQKINATRIKNTSELKAYLEDSQKEVSHTFFILRNQQSIEIKVNQILPGFDK